MRPISLALAFALAFALAGASLASGQSLGWGASAFSPSPLGYDSQGNAAGTGLTWTVGYFSNGFVPTPENHADWWTNYVIVDTAAESGGPPYSLESNVMDVGPQAAGKQIYLFAYNDPAFIGTPQGEVVLLREDGLLFPNILESTIFDIADNPLDPADNPFTVIWGQVDRLRTAGNGRIAGGGFHSQRLADTSSEAWEIQAATWSIPPATPFEIATWAIADPDLRDTDDDPDDDGRSNLIEHAAGTAMATSDAGYAMIGPADPSTVLVTLPASRKSDVRYTVQYNEDLGIIWNELAKVTGNAPWEIASPLSTTNVPNNRQKHEFTTPTGSRGFFRLEFRLVSP